MLAPNDEWGIDFVSDTLASGRRFRCFTVVDVCTHECLALVAAHSLPSVAVIEALEHVIDQLACPEQPKIMLDGTANRTLLEAIFPHTPIRVEQPKLAGTTICKR